MTDQTERNYGRAFLVTAAAWAANPARRKEELVAPARRLIYRCLRTYCDEAARCDRLLHTPDFSAFTRRQVYRIIMQTILRFDASHPFQWRMDRTREDEHEYYASRALWAADLGDDNYASPEWSHEQNQAWARAPFRLTMADVAEAWKGRDRCADDPMWPEPTSVPSSAVPSSAMTSSDDDDCCTFEELEAALTQLAPEKADGNPPVTTNATRPTASAFVPTVAPTFAAPQASATSQTAGSPTPFFYFTGDKLAAAEVRVKATAPTTAFPFSTPVVGYKGLTAVDVQRSEPAKPCCTRTYRLRKSRAQFLQGLPAALRLRYITAYHRRRMRVLQGREHSHNRALLESAKAGCGDTHVRQNKSEFFSAPRFVREELRPGYPDWTARLRASYGAASDIRGRHCQWNASDSNRIDSLP